MAEITSRICFPSFLSFLFYEAIQGYGHKIKWALQGSFTTGHHLEVSVVLCSCYCCSDSVRAEGGGESRKQSTDLSPVSGIMTWAWVENTINDSLILGLWKRERRQKHISERHTGAQRFIHLVGLTPVIFILQPPRNPLLNYNPKTRGVKEFLCTFSSPRCQFVTLLFFYVYQILPVTEAVPTDCPSPEKAACRLFQSETGLVSLTRELWDLKTSSLKASRKFVKVKSNAVWIDSIEEFNNFFFSLFLRRSPLCTRLQRIISN